MEIQRAGNTPDHEIVDFAGSTGVSKVSASPTTAYINAMIWAILIPAVFLFLVVILNNRIMSRDDIESLTDLPIVGTLIRNIDKRGGKLLLSANSLFNETLRIIKIKLNLDSGKGEQVVLVTSASPQDGKTYVAKNLASVYAMAGKRTLLLDFDLQHPGIAEHFGLEDNTGVTNFLINDIGVEEVIRKTFTKNLDILTSGPVPPNPDELIESEKTHQLFAQLRRRYDYIIMDTPPIGFVGDAYLLDRYSDTTLFVVRYNHTTKKHFSAALSEATENHMKRVNIVFTDLRQKMSIGDISPAEDGKKTVPPLRALLAVRRSLISLVRKF